MKGLLAAWFACLFTCSLHAQVVDATVCDILKDPQSFNGKTVRIKGTVAAGFDQFVIKGPDCGQKIDAIWLSYPEGSKAKAGPAAILELQPAHNFAGAGTAVTRSPVSLEKSKDFKQFDSSLSTPYKSGGMCLGCIRYEVSATLVGRLDGTKAALRRDDTGKIVEISGFGNLTAYSSRLVLQSVSDVVPHEVDYSKVVVATKSDSTQDSGGGDPVAAAHQASRAFGPNSAPGDQIARAADAFGKEGEDNGVNVSFSGANESVAAAEQQSGHNSPDGVLYNCVFDESRMKGDALARAIVQIGDLIADIRNPLPGFEHADSYELEHHAWTTAVLSSVANGQKTLTLPGGYLLWNAAWSPADREKSLNDAITGFLGNEELLAP